MAKIVIIQGHPDPSGDHLCHALAGAYGAAAEEAGHSVARLEPARLGIEFLRSQKEQEEGVPNADILSAQQMIREAEHLVFVYPLWLGGMPALLKAFLEQVARPGFAYDPARGPFGGKLLSGRSARVIITMGMPGWWYRIVYRSASLIAFRIGILNFVGIRPVRATLIGMVGAKDFDAGPWLLRMARLGADAA